MLTTGNLPVGKPTLKEPSQSTSTPKRSRPVVEEVASSVIRMPGGRSSSLSTLTARQTVANERVSKHGSQVHSIRDLATQPSLCERITTADSTEGSYLKALDDLWRHIEETGMEDPTTPEMLAYTVLDYIDFLFVTSENTSPPSTVVAAVEKLVPRILELPHICKRIHKAIAGWVKRALGS